MDLLVRAVLELNSEGQKCCLRIAGLEKKFLEKRLPDVKIDNSIECLGKLSHVECLKMIATSDFSAIIREDKRVTKAGFPTKFSESFGCGKLLFKQQKYSIYSTKRKIELNYPVSWDFQMCFSLRSNDMYGISPSKNQIKNIGVDQDSTHG